MADLKLPRREFLKGAGVAGAGVAAAATGLTACTPQAATTAANAPAATPETRLVLTPEEDAFFSAAVDTIIPADQLSPSGTECGCVTFIDRQLASAWGGGAKMYRAGPFLKGTPEQGYQLPLTPHQFFSAGVLAANTWARKTYGKPFDMLTPEQRTEALTAMEEGKAEFDAFESRPFFQRLLQITMESFFSDPIYGGNRNKASWRMLGYPGLPATYADKIDEYRDKPYVVTPNPSPTSAEESDMVTKLNDVDCVIVGMGLTGGMLAKELTMAGLTVMGLERGPDRRPQEEFVLPRIATSCAIRRGWN
jgi:gluconate 2-dehydrogenase gamma chain